MFFVLGGREEASVEKKVGMPQKNKAKIKHSSNKITFGHPKVHPNSPLKIFYDFDGISLLLGSRSASTSGCSDKNPPGTRQWWYFTSRSAACVSASGDANVSTKAWSKGPPSQGQSSGRCSTWQFFSDFVDLHPGRLTWNIIMEVWFRSFSFLNGWLAGSILIFQGVVERSEKIFDFSTNFSDLSTIGFKDFVDFYYILFGKMIHLPPPEKTAGGSC